MWVFTIPKGPFQGQHIVWDEYRSLCEWCFYAFIGFLPQTQLDDENREVLFHNSHLSLKGAQFYDKEQHVQCVLNIFLLIVNLHSAFPEIISSVCLL